MIDESHNFRNKRTPQKGGETRYDRLMRKIIREGVKTRVLMLTATAVAWWIAALATGRPVAPAQIPAEAWFGLVGIYGDWAYVNPEHAGRVGIEATDVTEEYRAWVEAETPSYGDPLSSLASGGPMYSWVGGGVTVIDEFTARLGRAVGATVAMIWVPTLL